MKFFGILALCIVAASAHFETAGLVQSSWNEVKKHETDMVAAVFKAYPSIQARFPQFAGKNVEDIKDTAEFAIHAGRIVNFISEVIAIAGKPENMPAVKTLLNQLGTSHRNRGISKDQFDDFHKALIGYISTHASWNNEVEQAWNQMERNMHAILYPVLDGNTI